MTVAYPEAISITKAINPIKWIPPSKISWISFHLTTLTRTKNIKAAIAPRGNKPVINWTINAIIPAPSVSQCLSSIIISSELLEKSSWFSLSILYSLFFE